jgi:hypothetical protein
MPSPQPHTEKRTSVLAPIKNAREKSILNAWTSTTTLIPIVVSVAALAVSALAYFEQRGNDAATLAAASLSAEQQYASQVSFWIDVDKGIPKPVLVVENLGAAPIANVNVNLSIVLPSSVQGAIAEQNYALGVIPPCMISSTAMTADEIVGGNAANQASASAAEFQQFVASPSTGFNSWVDFTDAAGRSWRRNGDGSLREINDIPAMPAVVSLQSTFKPTATCS